MKWKNFPRYWPFVRGIHRSPVNSPHKGQWCGALMFSLICARINGWVNNREAGDLRRHQAHCGVIVMTHWYYHSWYYRSEWIIAAVIQLGISLNGTVVKSATDLAIFVNPILYAFFICISVNWTIISEIHMIDIFRVDNGPMILSKVTTSVMCGHLNYTRISYYVYSSFK